VGGREDGERDGYSVKGWLGDEGLTSKKPNTVPDHTSMMKMGVRYTFMSTLSVKVHMGPEPPCFTTFWSTVHQPEHEDTHPGMLHSLA
jgi:hypothetical protein